MFDNIAPKYDFLNHFLSFGIDIRWRKKAIQLLEKEQPVSILDIATGTADFAIAAMKLNPKKVVGLDLSKEMLKIGEEKILKKKLNGTIELIQGDSEKLPFEDNIFNAITVGFGVRNFENLEKAISEMHRVLKHSGTVVILEFSKPRKFPFRQLFGFYFMRILPAIGRMFSGNARAYSYLPESVDAFPDGKDFQAVLKKAGFRNLRQISLTFGIASIYLAKKTNIE